MGGLGGAGLTRRSFPDRGAPRITPCGTARCGGSLTTSPLGKAWRAAGARTFGFISCARAPATQLVKIRQTTKIRMSPPVLRFPTQGIAQAVEINYSRSRKPLSPEQASSGAINLRRYSRACKETAGETCRPCDAYCGNVARSYCRLRSVR